MKRKRKEKKRKEKNKDLAALARRDFGALR